MSLRHKWQNIGERDWQEIRDAWLGDIPSFPSVGAPPDPGLEHLPPLLEVSLPETKDPPSLISDVPGVRRNALWEAMFLFHKCSHASLAGQRLGQRGMPSWCLFNAYHSAFLGAKATMALLGIAFPNLHGHQVALDLFPEPPKKTKSKTKQYSKTPTPLKSRFQHFQVIPLPKLDQRFVWEALQRTLRMSKIQCIDNLLRQEILDLGFEEITPPRNHFLYQAHFWPLDDLILDLVAGEITMDNLFGTNLDVEEPGFLLRLCYSVYRILEQMLDDLGQLSLPIKEQIDGSRCRSERSTSEIGSYNGFLSQQTSPPSAST